MICKNCGEFLDDNVKFCTSCGAKQGAPAAAPSNQGDIPTHEGYVVGSSKSVDLLTAIKLYFTHYVDFQGRSRRSEYWWVVLFNTVVGTIIGLALPDFAWIWSLVILVPTLALLVRRLHDAGKSGWFYIVAGPKARGIDGPTHGTIPPYNHYVVLTPADPAKVAKELAAHLGCEVAIVDINDLGANILGYSSKELEKQPLEQILGDNPLGQGGECTPMGIIRKA